jgi:uncharacterized protein
MLIRKIAGLVAVALLMKVSPSGAEQTASFDCGKAATVAERKICADPDLSRLDLDLANAYGEALNIDLDTKQLRSAERAWLHNRDSCLAGSPDCGDMAAFYRVRIGELNKRSLERECNSDNGPALAACASRKTEAIEKKLASLIVEMKSSLFDPNAELVAQEAWEQYREKECRSRITLNASWGGAEYQECLGAMAQRRLDDLRNFHFCDDNGCPAKK